MMGRSQIFTFSLREGLESSPVSPPSTRQDQHCLFQCLDK